MMRRKAMTWTGRRFLAAMGLAGAFALGGCAYDDGYYGGVSVGSGYYGRGYYDDYWGPGYYSPGYYSGWYNGFYYPGSGYYVYDRRGHRHRWNSGQRRYWEGRREARRGDRDRSWSGTYRQYQAERGWRGRTREGGVNTAPANPPQARSQSGRGGTRGDWGARSTQRSDDDRRVRGNWRDLRR
jgi:hypothetical protein